MDGSLQSTGFNVSPGDLIAGRYELHERLGAGGMGMVFRATDRELDGEVVAIKLLLPHLAQDENVFRRFRNEVLVARSLTHPNIVRTHDIGKTAQNYSYISMEFVDGVSLRDRLHAAVEENGRGGKVLPPLAFEEALSFLYQIICGVSYAHGRGVIHRDLKPANVMISKTNEVKLADFGTARMVGADTSLTQTGQVIGTPDYMSPEQIRGEELDTSCDIYALGILAYELVSGKRPFVADSAVAVAFKHLNEPLPSLVGGPGRVPVWFDEIVRKAAAKKKTDRFASVNDLAGALIDFAPELSAQSTLFSADRRDRRTSPTLTGRPAVTADPEPLSQLNTSLQAELGRGAGLPPEPPQGTGPVGQSFPPESHVDHAAGGPGSSRVGSERRLTDSNGDRSFELGRRTQRPSDDQGDWKLGHSSFPDREERPYGIPEARKSKGALWIWIVLAVLIAFVIPRFVQPLNQALSGMLFKENEEPSPSAVLIGSLFGVRAPEAPIAVVVASKGKSSNGREPGKAGDVTTPPTTVATSPSSGQSNNTQATSGTQTVSGSNPTGASSTVPATVGTASNGTPSGSTTGTGAGPDRSAAPTSGSVIPSTSTVVPNGTENRSATTVPTSVPTPGVSVVKEAPREVPTATPVPATVEKATVALALRENGVTLRDASVALDRLGQLSWSVELSGIDAAGSGIESKVRENLSVEVFDLRKGQSVASLRFDQLTPPAKADAPVRVSGGFQALRATLNSSGSFRVQALYKGSVLATKELVLYRAQAAPQPMGSGDNVTVVRGAAVTGGAGGSTISIPQDGPSPLPSAVPQRVTPPVTTQPQIPVSVTSQDGPRAGSGLPPAKGHEASATPSVRPSSPNGGGASTGAPENHGVLTVPQEPVAPALPSGGSGSDVYSGRLLASSEGTPPMSIELRLQFSGEAVSGSATIAGVGEFEVSGHQLQRGMEFELKGGDQWLRLTSGPRGESIRGRYSFPAKQSSGRFEVRRR